MIPDEYLTRPFWDEAPRISRGDAEPDSLYHAIGWSLSQWEEMEVSLSRVFAILVESNSEAAARAYGGLASATARMEALKRAAEIYYAERAGIDAFKALMKVIGYAGPRRNDIAHGVVQSYASIEVDGGGYYLIAPLYNSRRFDPFPFEELDSLATDPFEFAGTRYAYTSVQVRDFGERFRRLATITLNFARNLPRS